MPATKVQSRPALLTDAQREVLMAAAKRPGTALMMPARLKGKAAQRLAQALLDKGLVREIRSKRDLPVWRKDDDTGRTLSLVLSKAGLALASQLGSDGAEPLIEQTPPAPVIASPTPIAPDWPRAGTKMAAVITLLDRTGGSSVAELMTATGWLPHTTRAALTSLRKRGFALTREAAKNGSVYRITRDTALAPGDAA